MINNKGGEQDNRTGTCIELIMRNIMDAKSLFYYDEENGVLRRKNGKVAGCRSYFGYIVVEHNRKKYFTHKIIWFLVYGHWPKEVDHINGVRDDNRLCNLREVNRSDNLRNKRLHKNNTSGCHGVSWIKKEKKWQVSIRNNGKGLYLGQYADFFEAVCVRKSAEHKYGYHENHGRS